MHNFFFIILESKLLELLSDMQHMLNKILTDMILLSKQCLLKLPHVPFFSADF